MTVQKLHLIGICGIAMGTLACMLAESGYEVAGSDENVYPPMSDILAARQITLYSGFRGENIGNADLVIVGNAISRGNPEVEFLLNRNIPYLSMAQAIQNFFLRGKETIAVAGTHGKSTTTALLAHILHTAGLDPSFFVGGVANNFNASHRLGKGRYFVIEGDEYDSAFFEKVPKFIFYRPRHALLTSLEFDHADIYNNLGEIELWFKRLINMLPGEGSLAWSAEYRNLGELVSRAFARTTSFGKEGGDVSWRYEGIRENFVQLRFTAPERGSFTVRTTLLGEYNYQNIAGAIALCLSLGVDLDAIREGIATFKGVRRRQELIYSNRNVSVYEDFAHHPTAIRLFLSTMKNYYPAARLWAVYEPRSATSRRNVFQRELPDAFVAADDVLIKSPYRLEGIPADQRIDIHAVVDAITERGGDAWLFDSVDGIVDHLGANIDGDGTHVVAIMSNGGFDGIYEKIKKKFDTIA